MNRFPLILVLLVMAACRQDMHDQAKLEAYESSEFFADGRAVRPQVEGTVARGQLRLDDHLYRGLQDGAPAVDYPMTVDRAFLERGQSRYQIFCAICHDATGFGQGMAVQRGVKAPTSLHIDRLRESPPGYFFDVITNGYGSMYDYSDRIPVEDRWAITAYVKALQLSRHASIDDVPASERGSLEESLR